MKIHRLISATLTDLKRQLKDLFYDPTWLLRAVIIIFLGSQICSLFIHEPVLAQTEEPSNLEEEEEVYLDEDQEVVVEDENENTTGQDLDTEDQSGTSDIQPKPVKPNGADSNPSQNSPSGSSTSTKAQAAATEINVKNADINAIIRIFGKKLRRNYILDEKVKGKVSIFLPAKVSDAESVNILDAILALKGFTTVPIGENLWKVLPIKEAKQSTIPTLVGDEKSSGSGAVVTRLARLKHVDATEMQQVLSPLISPEGLINAYARSNSLILIDSADNIDRLFKIIKAVDIASSDRDMTIITIKHADATELAQTLQDILSDDGGTKNASNRPEQTLDLIRARIRETQVASMNRAAGDVAAGQISNIAGGSATVQRIKSGAPKIIPDERTNSIIIVADDTDTARIKALIEQLDSTIDLSGFRFYVYRCQHANAEELAEILGGITGGQTNSNLSSSSSTSGFGGDSTGISDNGSTSRTARNSQSRQGSQSRNSGQNRRSRTNATSTSSAGAGSNFSEDLSITADPATNSLIIAANKSDYEKIKELLQQLDIKRRQVLVEATLLEVNITDGEELGTQLLGSTGGSDGGVAAIQNYGGLQQLLSNPSALQNFSIAAASAGTLTLPGGLEIPTQTALITAAKNNSNANILSAPTLLTADNEEAEIVVGRNVPFISSTSTSNDNLNNTFNQVDRQDVGITLRLTPQISSGDFVTLRVFTEVSGIIENSSELGPTTSIRTSSTTVITKDNQMVIIGGLMSDDVLQTERGIPVLKDIPVLGALFKLSRENRNRNNLLIFITPRIIKDQFDHRDVTLTHRDSLERDMLLAPEMPQHEEIMRNPGLDDVAESTSSSALLNEDNIKPSTIRAPIKLNSDGDNLSSNKNLSKLSLEQNSESKSAIKLSDQDKIEVKLAPALPTLPSVSDPALLLEQGAKLVVLQSQKVIPQEILEQLPFAVSPQQRVFLVLPSESSQAAQQYFQPGSIHSYKFGSDMLAFEVSSVINGTLQKSGESLLSASGQPQDWYTISAHELLNLGRGPWYKKK